MSGEARLIRETPLEERPREKFGRHGSNACSDAELLAILLRTGSEGRSVVQMAQELLDLHGGLVNLARCDPRDLMKIKGIKRDKAVTLQAALKIHERIVNQQMQSQPLDAPERIHQFMEARVMGLNVEVLFGLALDSKLRLIRCYEISRGLLNQTLAHAREAFREAITCSAAHLVLVHNHPSGDPHPSADDLRTTREMAQAGKLLGIPLLDHVILGRPSESCPKGYVSLKQMGVLEG